MSKLRGGPEDRARPEGGEPQLKWGDVMFRFAMDGKVVRGKDDWLFLDQDRNGFLRQFAGKLRPSEPELEAWRELLEERIVRIGELGARYRFLVAPETPCVYPEKLPDGTGMAPERTVQQIIRHLSESGSPAGIIYPLDDLLAEKKRRPVYRKTDSHWNDYGALVAYRRLIRELGEDLPVHEVIDEELEFYQAYVPGDLSYKLEQDPGPSWCARYLYARAQGRYDNCVDLRGSLVISECPHAPPATCIVFGDSACWAMLTFLAQTFRRLVFAQSDTIDYELIEQEKPDLVVTQMVERHLIVVPDDSTARSIQELEMDKNSQDRLRPRVRIWDELPSIDPDDRFATVETVEAARANLMTRGCRESATFVAAMAYAGLSPNEALCLSWQDFDGEVVQVGHAFNSVESPDARLRARSVHLLEPLADDLDALKRSYGSPAHGYVFPKMRSRNWQRWVRTDFAPAIRDGERPKLHPGRLCDTFGAVLIQEGVTPSEVGRLMGIERADVLSRFWYLMDDTPFKPGSFRASERIREVRSASEARSPSGLARFLASARHLYTRLTTIGSSIGWEDSLGVRPIPVETVERMRATFLAAGRQEEATFVSVMAYTGLLQNEARPLKWRQISDGALHVEGFRRGRPNGQKRETRERSIPLLEPLAEDLSEWRKACGDPERGWVFPNIRTRDWQAWVQGDYRRVARAVGSDRDRPHFLPHTYASIQIDEGVTLEQMARLLALTPKTTLVNYGHLFEEAHVQERIPTSATVRIRAARSAAKAVQRSPLNRILGRLRTISTALLSPAG